MTRQGVILLKRTFFPLMIIFKYVFFIITFQWSSILPKTWIKQANEICRCHSTLNCATL